MFLLFSVFAHIKIAPGISNMVCTSMQLTYRASDDGPSQKKPKKA